MNSTAIRNTLDIQAGRRVGLTTTDKRIFLQRRGVTTTLHWGDGNFSVELTTPGNAMNGPHHLTITRYTGGRAQLVNETFKTRDAAMKALHDNLPGYEIAAFTVAYCHGWVQYPYQAGDIFVSPVYYDGSESIRLVSTTQPIITFQPNSYEAATVDASLAPKATLQQSTTFPSWIHNNDREVRGITHCRERIAWLVSAYLLEESTSPLTCTLLQPDMTTPVESL